MTSLESEARRRGALAGDDPRVAQRGSPLLAFDGATVGYGSRAILRDVSFAVSPGELVGLVGPNGAGKSTLLRAVTKDATVLSGDITWGGRSLSGMSDRERARIVGVVPQAQPATFSFTARAFVEMGRHPHLRPLEMPGPSDAAIVDDVMMRTDTARLALSPLDELSGGDLQRLSLAQALAQQPSILLLDEPTSHLDLNHTLQVLDLVRELADEGIAVVGVLHDLTLAARYADRMSIIADGRASKPAPPPEALDAAVVGDVFGVRAVVRTDPVTGSVAVTPVVRDADLLPHRHGPRIGLVCGSGTGAAIMRQLSVAGHPIFAGALNRGDVDHDVAEAIGAAVISLPPFGEIDAEAEADVRLGYEQCACVVVSSTPFGRANLPNLAAAVACGRPLVLIGDMQDDRDFTHGEALSLWEAAVGGGGVRVHSDSDALAAVRSVLEAEAR